MRSTTSKIPVAMRVADESTRHLMTLHVIGWPYVTTGRERCAVPEGSKRLLVFVAFNGGRVDRRQAAGTLWPYGDDERAAGNLRSALWRLKQGGIHVLEADKRSLWLDPSVEFDLRSIREWADRLIHGQPRPEDLRVPRWGADAMDLLPGWYDDWVIFERERLRQRLLHAVESLSRHLVRLGRHAEAVDVALEAVRVEPLRETAHRVLLEAHVAEGNIVEAQRAHREFGQLVRRELGIEPAVHLRELIAQAMRSPLPAVST